ncbi:hypothetical protein AGDE_09013 [Angomonas deanei]|nr:hypothetical protein AGDE_09013 [Angomonas deanei]|eukprot:EPY31516.1 hypothetical protein AGDE_09013 [Angomonas deanei]
MNSVASANGAEDDVSEEALALQLMSRESTTTRRGKKAADTTAMHYGKACTLQHYQQFVQKVRLSVRKDYTARHDLPADFAGDAQMELEITQRTYSVIGAAFTQVFKQALPQLPTELRPLHENGYFAFDKLPGLFQQAMSSLQLRDIPVRQFVLHSTANSTTEGGVTEGTGAYDVDATPYPPGTFLTGVEQQDVTLREWSGGPHDPDSNLSRDPAQHEYLSVLRRLKRQTEKLAVMSVLDVLNDSDIVGHGSFSASTPLGLDQLFGPAKLVEDRLVSALQYPSRTGDKPVHFIEASFTSGKTALLGRLLRRAGADEKMALIRYTSTATPFVPGLDDHPVAFPARFWFRAALACAPFLIRVEELFSRSPSEPLWWGHARNWSYENFQKSIYLAAESSGRGRRLTSILVDDMDKVLDSMEQRWRPYVREEGKRNIVSANELLRETPVLESSAEGKEAEQKKRSTALSVLNDASHRRQFMRQWTATTGKSSISEVLQSSFAKLTTCLGQLDLVFTGSRVAPLFLEFSETACRRYYLPLAGGVGLQQRLRVLPLVAAVHALHQRNCLEMPGVLYEVIKNAPALTGKVLESFLSDRIILRNLQTGPTRVVQGTRGAVLLGSYQPQELFVELPLYQRLLRHPRSTRRRLVELLQKQLCSPTRYLNTLVDTTAKDVNSGLVIPCSATSCQVHPFALFTIFSYQESVDMSGGEKDASRDGSVLLNSSPQEMKEVRAWAEVWAEYRATVRYMGTTPERKRNALRVLVHGALLLRSAGVVGAQIDLHLQVPPYGFPLLATSVRSRNRRRRTVEDPHGAQGPYHRDRTQVDCRLQGLLCQLHPDALSLPADGRCERWLRCGVRAGRYPRLVRPHHHRGGAGRHYPAHRGESPWCSAHDAEQGVPRHAQAESRAVCDGRLHGLSIQSGEQPEGRPPPPRHSALQRRAGPPQRGVPGTVLRRLRRHL